MSLQLLPRMLATLVVAAAALLISFPWLPGRVTREEIEEIHRVLRGWLARLGHEAYAEAVKA